MLKTRVISSAIGLILLAGAVWTHQLVLGIVIFVFSLIGLREFYSSLSSAGYRPVRTIGYIACTPIIFIGLNGVIKTVDSYIDLFKSINYFSFGLFAMLVILFGFIVFLHDRYTINDIAFTFLGILYVAFLFSFIVLTRNLVNGFFYIWLIFIGAWATDTFAYFTGRYLGKVKLLPAISPNKTVEGAVGGIVGCVAATVLYGVFINRFIGGIELYHFAVLGILNGCISQLGDWAASAIKRYVKIKDYGKLMPGHGGVLDRFDSILFVAPVVYFYISFVILQ